LNVLLFCLQLSAPYPRLACVLASMQQSAQQNVWLRTLAKQ
jgi:hypothetical protein